MPARIHLPDLAFAAFLVALGLLALVLTGDLSVGSATAMGPGYVPRALAVVIIAFGAVMGARALWASRQAFPRVALRPLLLIGASVALFALLLPVAGLALTSVAVVLCAGAASHDVGWRENVVLALALGAFAVGLFVLALGLPMPIWPPR